MDSTHRQAAIDLGTALAPLLPGWSVEIPREDYYWADLVRAKDGARIRISVGGFRQEGRVVFRGCWPTFRDGTINSNGPSVNITCNASKKPEALAKDITRRLLPEYDEQYADALAYVERHDRAGLEAEMVAGRIASIIGGRVGENRSRRGDGVSIVGEPEVVRRLVVNPSYGHEGDEHSRPVRVDFEVHGLDPETAAQVLEIIRRKSPKLLRKRPSRFDASRKSHNSV